MKKVVIGVLAGGCLTVLTAIGLFVALLPQMQKKFQADIDRSTEEHWLDFQELNKQREILETWAAPDINWKPEDYFPVSVMEFNRNEMKTGSKLTEIGLHRPGLSFSYSTPSQKIEVHQFSFAENEWNFYIETEPEKFTGTDRKSKQFFCTKPGHCFIEGVMGNFDINLVWNRNCLFAFKAKEMKGKEPFSN